MKPGTPESFWQMQQSAVRRSFWLLPFIGAIYFICFGLVIFAGGGFVFLILQTASSQARGSGFDPALPWLQMAAATAVLAGGTAAYQWYRARYHAADLVVDMVRARPMNPKDRYHQRLLNVVEEMRIAAGLPKVALMVVPSPAVNSMAVLGADGQPKVLVSEGMLAHLTRDEQQAAVAHELAHLINGDTFFVTVLCSLAGFFERMKEFATNTNRPAHHERSDEGAHPFLYIAAAIGALLLKLLSTTISRTREFAADAKAVELTRNPAAVAGAVYKAQMRRSFLGSFPQSFTPMFIVAPESEPGANDDGWLSGWFSTHPPMMERVKALSSLAKATPEQLIHAIHHGESLREAARVDAVPEQDPRASRPAIPAWWMGAGVLRKPEGVPDEEPAADTTERWELPAGPDRWSGAHTAEELVGLPFFSLTMFVRRAGSDQPEVARDNARILRAFKDFRQRNSGAHRVDAPECPHCRVKTRVDEYEGVPTHLCPKCRGRLVKRADVLAVLTRREVKFPPRIRELAKQFRFNAGINPRKRFDARERSGGVLPCPFCGVAMLEKPFSYQYFVPVDECVGCAVTWFDQDELEVLQALVEEADGHGGK
ncbi:MAG: zinc metalloprotease HtpX [Candidatus Sumerlaeia bacterium]|nr:zinc metalloprotease HtpX [Candidatus Sumerlaeia bacterium]